MCVNGIDFFNKEKANVHDEEQSEIKIKSLAAYV